MEAATTLQNRFQLRMIALWLCALALFTVIFWSYPQLDLWVSRQFFNPENVHRFPLMYDPVLRFIQKSIDWISYALIALLTLLVLVRLAGRARFVPLSAPQAGFLLLALALGPGLMVQAITKETFNRPRPVYVKEFTGPYDFIPPLVIGKQEGKSFVSGHAAMGFYLAALALLQVKQRRRWLIYGSAIILGLGLGGCRLIQGRHFISDVLFSGALTLLMVHVSYLIMQRFGRL